MKEGYRKLPDGRNGLKEYYCKESHELVITKISLTLFAREIGFLQEEKNLRLYELIRSYKKGPYQDTPTVTLSDIQFIDGLKGSVLKK